MTNLQNALSKLKKEQADAIKKLTAGGLDNLKLYRATTGDSLIAIYSGKRYTIDGSGKISETPTPPTLTTTTTSSGTVTARCPKCGTEKTFNKCEVLVNCDCGAQLRHARVRRR